MTVNFEKPIYPVTLTTDELVLLNNTADLLREMAKIFDYCDSDFTAFRNSTSGDCFTQKDLRTLANSLFTIEEIDEIY